MRPFRPTRLIPLALALTALPAALPAQEMGMLDLKVTDPEGAPIAGAAARIDGVRRGVTAADGRVRVRGIAPGWHALKVTRLGRRPVAVGMLVPPGGVAELEVGLQAEAIALPGVSATVLRAKGILVREPQHGQIQPAGGRRFGVDEIRRSGAATLSGVLQRAPEVELVRGPHGAVLRFKRALAALPPEPPGGGLTPPDCAPAYYVDGVRFPSLESPDVFPLSEVEEVVLFPGNVPAAYGGVRASCGVVVIRTRGGPEPGAKPRTLRGPARGDKSRPRPLTPKAARTLGKQPVPKRHP
ncbi:MAG TPA: carboxypeptidase-like regulatory domain-containing protein [Longimicrobium sp.]